MSRSLTSFAAAVVLCAGLGAVPSPAFSSDIKAIVNGTPVTSYDVQRRAAFLKLQRRQGGAEAATTEMIEQALHMQEVARLNIKITDGQVDDAYARFAKNNKMQLSQLDTVLEQAGVGKAHFKEYIRSQMSWNQALSARFNSKASRPSQRDAVQQMLKQKGSKPSATEYMLQQVIFVVPAAERASALGRRKQEAESMRQRFKSCESTRSFAKGLVDVTVRDLGRTLEPALPPDWAEAIKTAGSGAATPVRETPRGVEFIGVCNTREVSDDRVAQMLVQTDSASNKGKSEELSTQYTDELRKRAKIVKR